MALLQPLYYPEWVDPRSKRRVACLVAELHWSANLPPSIRLGGAHYGPVRGRVRPLEPDVLLRAEATKEEEEEAKESLGILGLG